MYPHLQAKVALNGLGMIEPGHTLAPFECRFASRSAPVTQPDVECARNDRARSYTGLFIVEILWVGSTMDLMLPANPLLDLCSLVEETLLVQDDDDPGLLDEGHSPPFPPTVASSSNSKKTAPITVRAPSQKKKEGDMRPPDHRIARRNAAASASRLRKRQTLKQSKPAHVEARPKRREEIFKTMKPITSKFNPLKRQARGPVATALDDGQGPEAHRRYTLDKMVGPGSKWGFEKQEWDGRKPMAILDNDRRVIGVLAGRPEDPNWPLLMAQAAEALESRRPRCHLSKQDEEILSRRGDFVALRCGVSHGGGQTAPSNLYNHPENVKILEELNSLSPFRRLAGFASSIMATWAPELYNHYRAMVDALHQRHPDLVRVFPSAIFSGYSYNLGPSTVCSIHKDKGNKATGECSVTPFGNFDYKKGGHLILWDLHKVIEFPPGLTILFPSAILAHSNVAIADGETRYSFAQYSASGLFRWVESGFRTRNEYLATLSQEELAMDKAVEKNRVAFGLSLLPTISNT